MSEHEDLAAIYGAIDRAVRRDGELRSTVKDFLPAYEDPGAIGWFEQFEAWTVEIAGASPFPDYDRALENLAERSTSGRMAARRLLVMAVAARLGHAHLVGEPPPAADAMPDIELSIERTLQVAGIAGTPVDEASTIVSLLTDPNVFGSIRDWARMIETGVSRGLLVQDLLVHAVAPPCSGRLVAVPVPGDPFPATELKTSFTTTAVNLQQAERFLTPSIWPQCSSFWCVMDLESTDADGTCHYHEIVSLDCAKRPKTWTAEAYLMFMPRKWATGASVTYALEPGRGNNLIDVDEGALVVQKDAATGAITVETVKRIRFTHPFNGPSLSLVMCVLGYGHLAEHLVLDCAVQNANDEAAGTPFEGVTQPTRERASQARAQRIPQHSEVNDMVNDVLNDAVDKFKQNVDECVTAYKASYDKMNARTYTADDLVTDVASMWTRYLRGAAAATNIAMQTAAAYREQSSHESKGAASDTPAEPAG